MKMGEAMRKRMLSAFCLISFIMGLLFLRFYALANSEELAAAANRQGTRTLTVSTSRGQIYDYRYQKLVNTQKSYVAAVLPSPSSASILLDYVPVLARTTVLEQLQKGNLFTTELAARLPEDTIDLHTFVISRRYADDQLAPHIIGHMTNGGTDGGYGF